jgi:hypothetical protein
MRSAVRSGVQVLVLATLLGAWWPRPGRAAPVEIGAGVVVSGATDAQVELVRWAIGRFTITGLALPAVTIRFHGDVADCGGHLGFARAGVVDVCTTLVNAMTRRNLLHELGHIWLDANADDAARTRFMELRGLRAWNDPSDPWARRGYEQGAEIISWAIGERILTAQVPDNDPVDLLAAFEVLTGSRLPDAG